jgi:hypothetical protein
MARKNEELTPAKAQAHIKSLRTSIDKLDLQILKLINERAYLAGKIKSSGGFCRCQSSS